MPIVYRVEQDGKKYEIYSYHNNCEVRRVYKNTYRTLWKNLTLEEAHEFLREELAEKSLYKNTIQNEYNKEDE